MSLAQRAVDRVRFRRPVVERISFRGHPMVRATHRTTFEVTTDEHLTPDGDCIIGVGADRGCAQLGEAMKEALRSDRGKVRLTLTVGVETFVAEARGDPGLDLSHPHDMVIRKSGFLSDRTLAVGASAAARDIPRSMVAGLRSSGAVGTLLVEVE